MDAEHGPWIEDRQEIPYFALPVVTDMDSLARDVPPVEEKLLSLVGYTGADPYPIFWRYTSINMSGALRVDVGARLTGLLPATTAGNTGVLPAGRYLCRLHQGDPGGVAKATGRLLDWAQFQGLVFDRPESDPDGWICRLEEYLVDPADAQDPRDWRIRIALKLTDTPQVQHLAEHPAAVPEPT